MSEPTSVLTPPAKAATRAAIASPVEAQTLVTGMPDASPLDDLAAPATISPGDADDLIAQLADEQINRLLADEDDGVTTPPPPPQAEPEPVATTPVSAPFVERRKQPAETPAFPASFSPPGKTPAAIDASPADRLATAPIEANADPHGDDAPPGHESVAHESVASPVASPVDVHDAHDALRSDAAAVAAELADNVAQSPTRVAAPAPVEPIVVHDHASESSAIGRAVHAIGVVPAAIVDVINLPVRAANDGAREAIGAIAIVTLANAAALLLYLMIFQR